MAPRIEYPPEHVAEIKRRYESGETRTALSRWLGVSPAVVDRIIFGHNRAYYGKPEPYCVTMNEDNKIVREQADRLAKFIPQYDTRTLTGCLMGDPEPSDHRR